jgi:hypothetical protein
MDWRVNYNVTCFQCGLRHATNTDCVFCALSVPIGYERIRERELTLLEFRSSKGTAEWPEEVLEGVMCDVTFAVFTVTLRV